MGTRRDGRRKGYIQFRSLAAAQHAIAVFHNVWRRDMVRFLNEFKAFSKSFCMYMVIRDTKMFSDMVVLGDLLRVAALVQVTKQ